MSRSEVPVVQAIEHQKRQQEWQCHGPHHCKGPPLMIHPRNGKLFQLHPLQKSFAMQEWLPSYEYQPKILRNGTILGCVKRIAATKMSQSPECCLLLRDRTDALQE